MKKRFLSILFLLNSLCALANPFHTFVEDGKVGLKNNADHIVIPARYDALGWSNGSFSVTGQVTGYKLKGFWGVLNLNNERITPPDYSSLTTTEGFIIASKQSQAFKISTGCIDAEGKVIIPFNYTGVKIHSLRAIAFIREGNLFKHGLIDLENKILIPFQYRNVYPIGSLRYAVEDFNGKTALFSEGGRQITGFTIDSISHFNNDIAIIYEGERQGLITRDGELKSEAKYREIKFNGKEVLARMPDEWHVLNAQNKQLNRIDADSLSMLSEGRYKIANAGIIRLVDDNLKPVNETNFTKLASFKNGLAVFKSGEFYGVIKKNGKTVLPGSFQKIFVADDYIITVEKKIDKITWSLRDTVGQRLTPRSYDLILPRNETIFPALKNGYWGAVDKNGKEIVACVYDTILESCNNQLAVKFRGQYGIISLKEDWLAFPQPHKLKLLNGERYFKKKDGLLMLCTFSGTTLYFTINPIEVKENYFVEFISSGGTWHVDFDGRIVSRQLPPQEAAEKVEKIFPSTEGLRGIKKNGQYGFIDDLGRLRVANRYEDIKPFSEGLAAIKIRNKWGFINRDEKIMIQPAYEDVTPFEKNYSLVKQNGMYGLLTREGKLALPTRYNEVSILANGHVLLTLNGMKGLGDQQGNVLLQPKYNSLQDLDNGYVIIEQDGKFGLVTSQGLSTIPLMYDELKFDVEKNRYLALKKSGWVVIQSTVGKP
jgi:hypothetical protein